MRQALILFYSNSLAHHQSFIKKHRILHHGLGIDALLMRF